MRVRSNAARWISVARGLAAGQIWKEGVARYTEIRVAERAARHFAPSRA